jgi:DNA-binding transcriptional ArsR family regulator
MNDKLPTTNTIAHPQIQAEADSLHNGNLARDLIQSLLDGAPPEVIRPAELGEWAEVVDQLDAAFREGGVDKVRQVFSALVKVEPTLTVLVSGEAQARKTHWTARELLSADFPEPRWAVPDLIPVGLSILAGRPKVGKSWLGMQIAIAVASGGRVLDREIEQGKVLYLALEDSPRRLKYRLQKQGAPPVDRITFATEWKVLSHGGLDELKAEVERGGYSLVIIDTISRALGRADQLDLGQMNVVMGDLQAHAQLHDYTILLIDHHRKSMGMQGDPVDDVMGSTGKAAPADAVLGLYREQNKQGVVLRARGRDMDDQDLALRFDGLTFTWQLAGEVDGVKKGTVKADILDAIRELAGGGKLPTTTSIATRLGKDKGAISRELADLENDGKVIRGEKVGREQPYYTAETLPESNGEKHVNDINNVNDQQEG